MKKIIIIIALFLLTATATLAYFGDPLVNLWNSRKDLQKAFPGDPATNIKLETWAKQYGWKEDTTLFDYYPDKAIVEKIIDNKVDDRIKALENQITNLTEQVSNCKGVTQIIGSSKPSEQYATRQCYLGIYGDVKCTLTAEDYNTFNANNGRVPVNFLTK